MNQTLACILTYGRSGSSAMSHYFVMMGSYGHKMAGPFFENIAALTINEEYLQGRMDGETLDSLIESFLRMGLAKGHERNHIKEPRILRLLDFWIPKLDQHNAKYIFMTRNPEAVKLSHQNTFGTVRRDILENIKELYDKAYSMVDTYLEIDFDNWIQDTRNEAQRIHEFLDWDWNEEAYKEYTQWLDPNLKHF